MAIQAFEQALTAGINLIIQQPRIPHDRGCSALSVALEVPDVLFKLRGVHVANVTDPVETIKPFATVTVAGRSVAAAKSCHTTENFMSNLWRA